MRNLEIRRPRPDDTEGLNDFFKIVITDTFIKEGIGDKLEDIASEIEVKKKYLESNERYFLIALDGEKIIGSIEYGPASELITNCIKRELMEVGTVFVAPDYQRNGVGNLLLSSMFSTLQKKGIEEFCLDSGYRRAQRIWKKKFGEPDYLLKNYWGEGFDHMIWIVSL